MISLTSPVKTPWHSWPAGLKLGLLCVATMVLFSLENVFLHLAAFAACIGLYSVPGYVFLKAGCKRLVFLWPFLAVIVIWHAITGTPVEGTVIALRLLTAVGLANLVTMTTRLSDMVEVVKMLLSPLRVLGLKTRPLEIAIALVVRFTPVLAQKGRDLTFAWRARSPKKPKWQIIMPFTLLAIDDAEHVAEALRARGGI
ncbi:energy-coupling factor transporter transmembrane component T family protein [Pseudohalocynthiibacter aestuariivivens]|jgi:biotin transport system permease protein|uniref:Energy-coupling factor transporter transmembrane component T family protein n=1 Tax=Pseudohalocynthiibacter aestuariivivens TaxID=1591409 RepID=A0ABV5JF21_9RHOB|nr:MULTISPECIES: energy-coupling factor transporter transmembrane protein EcfT [Pseudohalocynthiibacter]MBS9717918.1 energy-coupling factor transporter transmembrane protein EcfT [Pseudohalocynthiibacter aestuariivivens]MCK0102933.1 energy-coupling factor transporter transmembrane protein EcfT [Pseudohalocynthiibacter sp. F2068]